MSLMPFSRAGITTSACRALLLLALSTLSAAASAACGVSGSNINLGSVSSLTLATQSQEASGMGGLSCDALLGLIVTNYIKLRFDSSTLLLTGPGGKVIPFVVSTQSNGTPIPVGAEQDMTTTSLLSLFTGPSNSVPIFIRTTPTTGLSAGTYTGSITLRWYYSICTLGAVVCLATSQSPGFNRPLLGPVSWGTGVASLINITLTVTNDCVINAPTLDFGTAPLVSSFSSATRTIDIRCSSGAAYTVGLSDGNSFNASQRRMRRGTSSDYLIYEIYQTATSSQRWGSSGSERRSSANADNNPGIYDGTTVQGYTYRAVINPAQPTPPAGTYTDSVIVDVAF